ncbi:hypothetical protein EK904_002608 [Melospiza melodia maxima]|nr:hypothetical protein EK904_002608 [Melospiza melodia maxima]
MNKWNKQRSPVAKSCLLLVELAIKGIVQLDGDKVLVDMAWQNTLQFGFTSLILHLALPLTVISIPRSHVFQACQPGLLTSQNSIRPRRSTPCQLLAPLWSPGGQDQVGLIGGMRCPEGSKKPLGQPTMLYDHSEEELMASIEREYCR